MMSNCNISVHMTFQKGTSSVAVQNLVRNIREHSDITNAKGVYLRVSEDELDISLAGTFAYDGMNPLGKVLAVEGIITTIKGLLANYYLEPAVTYCADGVMYVPLNIGQDAAHIAYEAETVYQIVVNDQKQYRFLNREDSKTVKKLTLTQLNAIVNFSDIEYCWKAGFFTAGRVGLYNVHVNNEGFITAFRNARDEGFSVMEKYLSGE